MQSKEKEPGGAVKQERATKKKIASMWKSLSAQYSPSASRSGAAIEGTRQRGEIISSKGMDQKA